MTIPGGPGTDEPTKISDDGVRDVRVSPELQAELVQAMAEIDRGEYITLTFEQLDRAAATGEWPWPDDESLD